MAGLSPVPDPEPEPSVVLVDAVPARPHDSQTRRERLIRVGVGILALVILVACVAKLRSAGTALLDQQQPGTGPAGLALSGSSSAASPPDYFWPFLGISVAILIVGTLISAWVFDPIYERHAEVEERNDANQAHVDELEYQERTTLAELTTKRQRRTSVPERIRHKNEMETLFTLAEIAKSHGEKHGSHGVWSKTDLGGLGRPDLSSDEPLERQTVLGDALRRSESDRDDSNLNDDEGTRR